MKSYLRELVLLLAVFGGLPFDVASDANATPTNPPLRVTGGIVTTTQDKSVWVTAYGALGDGSHDDTSAIQAALDAVNTSGGGIVYFPTGTYVSGLLTASGTKTVIRGAGWKTVLSQKSGTGGAGTVFLRMLGDDSSVEDLSIATTDAAYAIRFNADAPSAAIKNSSVSRVQIIASQHTTSGIYIGWFDTVTVSDCDVENTTTTVADTTVFGITLHAESPHDSLSGTIRNNRVIGFGDGIESYGTGSRQRMNIEGNEVSSAAIYGIKLYHAPQSRTANNYVHDSGAGIFAFSTSIDGTVNGNVIVGNICRSNTTFGLETEQYEGATITGNTLVENQDGYILSGGTAAATISGNNASYNSRYGMWADKAQSPNHFYLYDLVFAGNVIKYNGQDGMLLGGIQRSATITGNDFSDNGTTAGSAATSPYAGLHLAADSEASNFNATAIVTGNTFGQDMPSSVGSGSPGAQGYGVLADDAAVGHVVVSSNSFSGNGQFDVWSNHNPVDLISNRFNGGAYSTGAGTLGAYANTGLAALEGLLISPTASTNMQYGSTAGNVLSHSFYTSGTKRLTISSSGQVIPSVSGGGSIGASGTEWGNTFSRRYMATAQSIAAASSITINPVLGDSVRINLSATAITSITYTAGNDGEDSTVCVAEDGTGSRTIPTTWTNVKFAGGSYTASTGASKVDCLRFKYSSSSSAWLETGRSMNM